MKWCLPDCVTYPSPHKPSVDAVQDVRLVFFGEARFYGNPECCHKTDLDHCTHLSADQRCFTSILGGVLSLSITSWLTDAVCALRGLFVCVRLLWINEEDWFSYAEEAVPCSPWIFMLTSKNKMFSETFLIVVLESFFSEAKIKVSLCFWNQAPQCRSQTCIFH